VGHYICLKYPLPTNYSLPFRSSKISFSKLIRYIEYSCLALIPISLSLSLAAPDGDYTGATVFAQSRNSAIMYTVSGLLNCFIYSSSFILFLNFRSFPFRKYVNISKTLRLLFLLLIARLSPGIGVVLSTSLVDYGTRLLEPIIFVSGLFILDYLRYSSIRYCILSLKINRTIFFVSFALIIFVFIVLAGFPQVMVSLFQKVGNRGFIYLLLNADILADVGNHYGGNFLYFFHPFLKLFGGGAYTLPIGSFIESGGLGDKSYIGGPNVHLPLTLYALSWSFLPLAICIITLLSVVTGYIIGQIKMILAKRILSPFIPTNMILYSSLFLSFPFFVLEPSAWGHSFFFSVIMYAFLVGFRF